MKDNKDGDGVVGENGASHVASVLVTTRGHRGVENPSLRCDEMTSSSCSNLFITFTKHLVSILGYEGYLIKRRVAMVPYKATRPTH